MAPIKQFALASLFLASALAQPSRRFAPFHYPVDNSTLSGASGTAPGTGISSATATSSVSAVSAAEFYQASSSAASDTSAAAAEASSGSGSGSGSGDAAGSCGAASETVTVTAVNTVTETVTPSAAAGSGQVLAESAGASTTAAASSAASSGFAYGSGHGYGHLSLHKSAAATASANSSSAAAVSVAASSSPSVSGSSVAAVADASSTGSAQGGEFYVPSSAATTVTSYAAPSSTSAAWSSSWTSAPSSAYSSSSSSWSSSATASATSSASQSTQSSSSGSSGKRGVAFNSASLANVFSGQSEVSWAYNWGQTASDLDSSLNFIPMLWGTSSTYTSSWNSNAQAAISAGTQYLMSFNEPDQTGQSLISPSDAATAYMTYMQPFQGKAKLGSPAVTNGGGSMGLNWLSDFTSACSSCHIDFTAIHWYGTDSSDFISHCQQAHSQTGLPVWVTEFGITSGDAASFLEAVMPWMDSQDWIEKYSYFMAEDGILLAGEALSSLGSTYCSSSSSNSTSSS